MSRTTKTFTQKDGEVRTIARGTPRAKCTPQELKFVEHYLMNSDGAAAAIFAGYSAKTAKQAAQKLLNRPCIKVEIEAIYAARREANKLTEEKIIAELSKIGFSDIDGKLIKGSDKVKALENLGRFLGMWKDRTEHSGSLSSTPVPENVSPAEAKEAYLKVIK